MRAKLQTEDNSKRKIPAELWSVPTASLDKMFRIMPFVESAFRLSVVQFKRAANLLPLIDLITMRAVCQIT